MSVTMTSRHRPRTFRQQYDIIDPMHSTHDDFTFVDWRASKLNITTVSYANIDKWWILRRSRWKFCDHYLSRWRDPRCCYSISGIVMNCYTDKKMSHRPKPSRNISQNNILALTRPRADSKPDMRSKETDSCIDNQVAHTSYNFLSVHYDP